MTWRHVLVFYLVAAAIWLSAVIALAQVAHARWEAQIQVIRQSLHLRLHSGLQARASTAEVMQTRLDAQTVVTVPIDQVLPVQLPAALHTRAHIQAQVPIDTVYNFDSTLAVSATITTRVKARVWLPELSVKVPVVANIPVHLSVPVHLVYPLDFDARVQAHLPRVLPVHVRSQITARVPVHADLQARVINQTDFSLYDALQDLPVVVDHALVHLPLGAIVWTRLPETQLVSSW